LLRHSALTERIIGLAIEVHRILGPGLLESVYRDCLSEELAQAGIPFAREVMIPVICKGKTLRQGFRADIIVANAVLLEIKGVSTILPAHEAQIRTYLRLSEPTIGLLLNFHAILLKDGLKRFIV
jgi:GxxExxY protein